MFAIRFRLPQNILYFLPVQAFRRLPRAGASPCTPAQYPPLLRGFRLPQMERRRLADIVISKRNAIERTIWK